MTVDRIILPAPIHNAVQLPTHVDEDNYYYFYIVGRTRDRQAFAVLVRGPQGNYGFRYFDFLRSGRMDILKFCGTTASAAVKFAISYGREVYRAETFVDIAEMFQHEYTT